MSVDVQRVTESVMYLNGLWLPLIWIIVCFVYLWQVCWMEGAGVRAESFPPPPLLFSLSCLYLHTLWTDIMGNILDEDGPHLTLGRMLALPEPQFPHP